MAPYCEDDDDPNKPRPVQPPRKGDGERERAEARDDDNRDHHRQVIVRC